MRIATIGLVIAALLGGTPLGAQPAPASPPAATQLGDRWTPALFDAWVKLRVGTGAPVYWYSVGTLRDFPSGRLLARVEGYDTARVERVSPTLARQFNRKTYIYRDPVTNAVLTEFAGKPVEAVAYPYQYITYELKDGRVETFVEQGKGKAIRRIGPGDGTQVKRVGTGLVFTAPVFLDFPMGPDRRYQAWENYDFFMPQPYRPGSANQLSWARYGDAAPAFGGKPSIMHLVTYRIDRYADVPATLRTYIEASAPLWREPPKDLADIRRLQAE